MDELAELSKKTQKTNTPTKNPTQILTPIPPKPTKIPQVFKFLTDKPLLQRQCEVKPSELMARFSST